MMNSFIEEKPVSKVSDVKKKSEELKKAALYLKKNNPGHVPVIIHIELPMKGEDVHKLGKKPTKDLKFIVDKGITMGNLMFRARKSCDIPSKCGLISIIDSANIMAPMSANVVELYEKYKNKDDELLHITMARENVFG